MKIILLSMISVLIIGCTTTPDVLQRTNSPGVIRQHDMSGNHNCSFNAGVAYYSTGNFYINYNCGERP